MNTQELSRDIGEWIMDWVSVHNEQLGHVPCPFARKALLDGKIEWIACKGAEDLQIALHSFMDMGLPNEVAVIGLEPRSISPTELSAIVAYANDRWLMPSGLVALEDHPRDVETKNGVAMNQGKWALVLVQETAKLNDASLKLRAQGYYDKWSKEDMDDVVNWRFK